MNLNKKLLVFTSLAILTASSYASNYYMRSSGSIKRNITTLDNAAWTNVNGLYNCASWEKDNNKSSDTLFAEIALCQQDQVSTIGKSNGVTVSYEEVTRTISVNDLRSEPVNNESCHSLISQDKALSSGSYTLSSGDTEYCEMDISALNLKKLSDKNYYVNGDFVNGKGSPNENGSNATNTFIAMNNPTGSGYAIYQSGPITSEYQVDVVSGDHIKGRYIALSLWTTTPEKKLTHGRIYNTNNDNQTDGGTLSIIKTEIVDGVKWTRLRYLVEIKSDLFKIHSWYVGYASTGSYFTGLTHEIYIEK